MEKLVIGPDIGYFEDMQTCQALVEFCADHALRK